MNYALPPLSLDPRHRRSGAIIHSLVYADQPYIVRTDDGAWLCVVTTGTGSEGEPGQHVTSRRSTDCGQTWSDPMPLELPGPPESSYAVLLKAPTGRIFCFYNYNTDNVRMVPGEKCDWCPDGNWTRVDTLGYFVFRWSDDHGRSWSADRITIPVREFAVDRANIYSGKMRFFWNVGRAFIHGGRACVPLHKVGRFGRGFLRDTEGVLLTSCDLFAVANPADAKWDTLPDGDIGIRPVPGSGDVAEEQSFSELSDGSLFVIFRTIGGSPGHAYSRDGGHTWTSPTYLCYADGRRVRHPRAATFVWRCADGRYLLWFHNHAGQWYDDRNPVWLAMGEEIDSPSGRVIAWGQPEIGLYDDDVYVRMSYPDYIEEGDKAYLTETQKAEARVHLIPSEILVSLRAQPRLVAAPTLGSVFTWRRETDLGTVEVAVPAMPDFTMRDGSRTDHGQKDLRTGCSFLLRLCMTNVIPGQVLFCSRTRDGAGYMLETAEQGSVKMSFSDGRTAHHWTSDRGLISPGKTHHIGIILDGGPKLVLILVDGILNDGAGLRQFGWGRFSPNLQHVRGGETVQIAPHIQDFRLFDRALRVTEVIGDSRL
jgi:hypothetical protein